MLFKSLPCGAKTCRRARAFGLASCLLSFLFLVPLAQADNGFELLDWYANPTLSTGTHLAVDTDGSTYLVVPGLQTGIPGDFVVVKLQPNGSSDPAWGVNGLVALNLSNSGSVARAITIQWDGKIVVAGNATTRKGNTYTDYFALVRYNPNGTLDSTFNYVPPTKKTPATYGVVLTNFGTKEYAEDVMVQPDGKIIIGGNLGGTISNPEFVATVRYNSNGTLDTTYGNGGIVTASFPGYLFYGINTLHPFENLTLHMGGVLFGGAISHFEGYGRDYLGLMRFTSSGLLDTTFSSDGRLEYVIDGALAESNTMEGFAIDSSNRIVVVADTWWVGWGDDLVIYRFTPDGSVDTTFGGGLGYVRISSADYGNTLGVGNRPYGGVFIQPDGKAVISGTAWPAEFGGAATLFVARFDMNTETMDTTFGGTGYVLMSIPENMALNAVDMQVLADGRITIAGTTQLGANTWPFVARFLPDGTPDPSF